MSLENVATSAMQIADVERTSQIQIEMDKYELLPPILAGSLEELGTVLASVLLPPSPTSVPEEQSPVAQSSTAARLQANNVDLESQIEKLNALIARIDL